MLEKYIWTEKDFDVMGWHDATLWAVAFLSDSYELALDIDYIVKWVSPEERGGGYRFWVAPATLVFRNVYQLCLDVELYDDISIDTLDRGKPGVPRNAAYIGADTDWLWKLSVPGGTISFRAAGYDQYCRRDPVLIVGQKLSVEARGGISFDRTTPSESGS